MTTPVLHRAPRHPHVWAWCLLLSQAVVIALWWRYGWQVGLPAMLASHLPFLWGTLVPDSALFGPVLARLPVADKRAWLTIDDGPSDDTGAILDLLDAHAAKATFFVVGERAQAALQDASGLRPRWFRAVVGMSNPFVAAVLRDEGLARVAWSARGFDGVRSDPRRVVARIEQQLRPGAIVLLHEGARHGRNVETLALLLQRLDALGYRSVLPEQLEAPAGISEAAGAP